MPLPRRFVILFGSDTNFTYTIAREMQKITNDLNIDFLCRTDYTKLQEDLRAGVPEAVLLFMPVIPANTFGDPQKTKAHSHIKSLVNMIMQARRSQTTTPLIIGFDDKCYMKTYMDSGADYFLPNIPPLHYRTFNIISYIISRRRIPESESSLIIEKQEFYNASVAQKDLHKRSLITADTKKEIPFLVNILNRFSCNNVLDAGCGYGRIAIPLADKGFNVTALDVSKTALIEAKSAAPNFRNPRFILGSLTHLPFAAGSFDALILWWHVICDLRHHYPEAFTQAYLTLKSKGLLLLDFPDNADKFHIPPDGKYEVTTKFGKYIGLIPELDTICTTLEDKGFRILHYWRKDIGIKKFVIAAQKV